MKKRFFTFLLPFLIIGLPAITTQAQGQDTNQLESQSTLPQIKRAAEEGDPDAQYALGYMYYYGRGVTQDMAQAKQWIKKAANQGQQQAVQAEKILLGTTPSIQPKVNPVVQPNGESPDKPNTPVAPRDDMKKEPVVTNDQKQVSEMVEEQKPALTQKEEPAPVKEKAVPATTAAKPEVVDAAAKSKPKKSEKSGAAVKPKTSKTSAQPLKNVKGDYFTIQLLSSSKKQDVVRFIAQSNLKQASYYQTYRDGQKWYVVTHGKYPTRKAATAAIQKLPESVKKNGPWVKSSAVVNKEIHKKH